MSGVMHQNVWLPEGEKHLVEVMLPGHKNHKLVDGKATYQYRKIQKALSLQPKDRLGVCLDIGAHVGLWSMWLTGVFQQTVAFEPIAEYRDLFRCNVQGNYLLYNWALGNSPEDDVVFTYPLESTGSTHRVATTGQDVRSTDRGMHFKQVSGVSVRRLDNLYDSRWEGPIDFIKIDVEGMELDVVQGAENTIVAYKPNIVIEQKGNDHLYFGHRPKAALCFLKTLGMIELDVIAGDYFMGWPNV